MAAAIKLHNDSDRTVTSVRIGVVMTVPPGCGASAYVGEQKSFDRPVVIPAGETREIGGLGIAYGPMRTLQSEHGGPLLSQITTVGVSFERGDPWARAATDGVFDESLMASDVQASCRHPHDE